jgi:hypothetical protein
MNGIVQRFEQIYYDYSCEKTHLSNMLAHWFRSAGK